MSLRRRRFLKGLASAILGAVAGAGAVEALERPSPYGLQGRLADIEQQRKARMAEYEDALALLVKEKQANEEKSSGLSEAISKLLEWLGEAKRYLQETEAPFQPQRIEDRTYDIEVSFEATDPFSRIVEASVILEGIYPPHIPRDAIPQEPVKRTALTRAERINRWERYSARISNLMGGKGYWLSAEVKNAEGKASESKVKVPYVREFINFARKALVVVNAHYMPFFEPGTWSAHWDKENGTPLLGLYEGGDDFVTARHVDWASGFGIGSFSLTWGGRLDHTDLRIRRIITSPLISDMNFFMLPDTSVLLGTGGPWDIDDPAIRRKLLEATAYLIENFLSHPSYLKVQGGRPIYYWASISWLGNVASLTKEFRNIAKDRGIDLYVIGDPVHFYDPSVERIRPFDAITQWANYHPDARELQNLVGKVDAYYRKWSRMAKSVNVDFIPSVLPGFRRAAELDKFAVLPRSAERFRAQLEIARKYIDPDLRMLFVTSFNDWTENTQVEPSIEEGFIYLELIKEFVKTF